MGISSYPAVTRAEGWRRILAWVPLVLTVAMWLPMIWLSLTICVSGSAEVWYTFGWLPICFSNIAFAALCGLIITRQPQNRIGWLCGVIGVLPTFINASLSFPPCAAQAQIVVPGVAYLAWFSSFFGVAIALQFFQLPLWFPNGRFQSAGWRYFALACYALLLLGAFLAAVWPGQLVLAEGFGTPTGVVNPFGLPFDPSPEQTRLVQTFLSISLMVGILVGNFSLLFRWRSADSQTRQQIKVFAFFLVTVGTIYFVFELAGQLLQPAFDLFGILDGWVYLALLVLLWVGYPVAIGVAVFRYRMYDVDVVIRKTLTYALVAGLLTVVYFGSVILLQQLFASMTGQRSEIITLLSTLAIAALFVPLRDKIQEVIDRRFYRKKYDAQTVLSEFAETVRDETDLEQLTARLMQVVQETMEPRSVSVWLRKEIKSK